MAGGTIGAVRPIPLTYPATSPDIIRRSRARLRVRLWDEARVILPILLVTGLALLLITHPDTQRAEALAKGKKAITAANAPAGSPQRKLAAGDRGCVIAAGDGSWVVIRHEAMPDSDVGVTVALDSGGQWHVNEKLRSGQIRYGIFSDGHACSTLAEAREKLRQLGFRVTPP